MEKDEINQIIREFYDSPLSFLEIEDEQTHIKMKKPVGSLGAASISLGEVLGTLGNDGSAGAAGGNYASEASKNISLPENTSNISSTPIATAQQNSKSSDVASSSTYSLIEVKAPLVGVFYQAPSPSEKPYVEEGATIKKGDTLCIIEAMKMMNEVKAEIDGVVKQILVEDSAAVGFGDILMLIEAQ